MKPQKATFTIPVVALLLITIGLELRAPLRSVAQVPMGTAFSYQGRLLVSLAPPDTPHDFTFVLFTNASAGNSIAGPVTNLAVSVSNGLFVTKIDFGLAPFAGDQRFLEIAVRPAGSGAFTTITPRQELTPAPYAIYASTAGTATFATTAGSASTATSAASASFATSAANAAFATNAGNAAFATNAGTAAAVSGTVICARRKYYMTQSTPNGANAINACVAGYHFASLAEIWDPSNLQYAVNGVDVPAGTAHTLPDSGSGPPFSSLAFVRVGVTGTANSIAGNANCITGTVPWSSASSNLFGTVIALKPTWTDAPSNVSPWDATVRRCDNPASPPPQVHVWCVQD